MPMTKPLPHCSPRHGGSPVSLACMAKCLKNRPSPEIFLKETLFSKQFLKVTLLGQFVIHFHLF